MASDPFFSSGGAAHPAQRRSARMKPRSHFQHSQQSPATGGGNDDIETASVSSGGSNASSASLHSNSGASPQGPSPPRSKGRVVNIPIQIEGRSATQQQPLKRPSPASPPPTTPDSSSVPPSSSHSRSPLPPRPDTGYVSTSPSSSSVSSSPKTTSEIPSIPIIVQQQQNSQQPPKIPMRSAMGACQSSAGNSGSSSEASSRPSSAKQQHHTSAGPHVTRIEVNGGGGNQPEPAVISETVQNQQQQIPPPTAAAAYQRQMSISSQTIKDVSQRVEALEKSVSDFDASVENAEREYRYLDEMLTRAMLALDNIDCAGREDIRAARRAVLQWINKCIRTLEAKMAAARGDIKSEPTTSEPNEKHTKDCNEAEPKDEQNPTSGGTEVPTPAVLNNRPQSPDSTQL